MSKLEDQIEKYFTNNNIEFEKQKPMPVKNWPWKTERSKRSPKCDFYIPAANLYVEVKGYMTIEAMSKLAFFCNQTEFNYFILQGTEIDWDVEIGDYVQCYKDVPSSVAGRLRYNVDKQLREIHHLCDYGGSLVRSNLLSRLRLNNFIKKKIEVYKKWNGKWVDQT